MQLSEHSGPFHCTRAQNMSFIMLELSSSSSSLIICACFSCLACFLCVSKIQFLPEYHGSPADAAASECLCKITSGPTPGFVAVFLRCTAVETFAGLLDKDTEKCSLLINFPPKYCHHSERLGGRIMRVSKTIRRPSKLCGFLQYSRQLASFSAEERANLCKLINPVVSISLIRFNLRFW